MQKGVGDFFDGGSHGILGADSTDDGGPAFVAALVLDTDALDVGDSDEILPEDLSDLLSADLSCFFGGSGYDEGCGRQKTPCTLEDEFYLRIGKSADCRGGFHLRAEQFYRNGGRHLLHWPCLFGRYADGCFLPENGHCIYPLTLV